MIEIFESSPPLKISGISSFIMPPLKKYDQRVIDTVKELPFRKFHKKEMLWEIPETSIGKLLDRLVLLDDIRIRFTGDSEEPDQPPLTEEEISRFRTKPFDHQIEAINFGLANGKWLLLDSMGLGKTLSIIYLAETLHERGLIDHCLIISGVDGLRQNWKNEILKFSSESVLVLGERTTKTGSIRYDTVPERVKRLTKPIDEFFVVVNAATLMSEDIVSVINKGKANRFGMIAVDEIHHCSSKSSVRGSNVIRLKAPYKVGATGTLLVRNPISAYGPLAFIEKDRSTLTDFKAFYCQYGGFGGYQITGYQHLETLKEEIESCGIRRTLDQVKDDMPPKMITQEIIELNETHRKFYENIRNGVKEEADKIELNTANLLALTVRLRQATSCPSALTTEKVPNSKAERCVELTEELVGSGEKVVIISVFKDTVYELAELLKEYDPLVCTGDVTDYEFASRVERFQDDPEAKVFIGTQAKCGTGITLNSSNRMIMIDEDWSHAVNAQSQDRIWRVTNTKPAFITILTAKDTIDEHVHEVADGKRELSDYMIDGKPSEKYTETFRNILKSL